jgi:uncharacterized membrane protein YtjA (UPF0391 family)
MLAFSMSFLASPPFFRRQAMLRETMGLGVVCLVIALIAALIGFGAVESIAWGGAKIFFFIFLVLAVMSFVGGFVFRDRPGFWGR